MEGALAPQPTPCARAGAAAALAPAPPPQLRRSARRPSVGVHCGANWSGQCPQREWQCLVCSLKHGRRRPAEAALAAPLLPPAYGCRLPAADCFSQASNLCTRTIFTGQICNRTKHNWRHGAQAAERMQGGVTGRTQRAHARQGSREASNQSVEHTVSSYPATLTAAAARRPAGPAAAAARCPPAPAPGWAPALPLAAAAAAGSAQAAGRVPGGCGRCWRCWQ